MRKIPNFWRLVRQICFNVNLIIDFKTVGLCLEKIPQNNMRSDWKPNHHKMRDLMATAMVANEQKMKKSQEWRNLMIETGYNVGNAPNISERMHVGNKTPVLGSMDLVTGIFFYTEGYWLEVLVSLIWTLYFTTYKSQAKFVF